MVEGILHPIIVSKDNKGHHSTLGAALEAAQDNQRIIIRKGTYDESVRLEKSVHIIAEGEVILRASNRDITLTVEAGGCSIEGLKITHTSTETSVGMGPSTAVFICTSEEACSALVGCTMWIGANGSTSVLAGRGTVEMSRCRIEQSYDRGLTVLDPAIVNISNCHFSTCGSAIAQLGGTISLKNTEITACGQGLTRTGGQTTLIDCTIHRNRGTSLFVRKGGLFHLLRCDIHDNEGDALRLELLQDLPQTVVLTNTNIYNHKNGAGIIYHDDLEKGLFESMVELLINSRAGPTLEDCELKNNVGGDLKFNGRSPP